VTASISDSVMSGEERGIFMTVLALR